MQVQTPIKDLPSLGFGSSSSPYVESPYIESPYVESPYVEFPYVESPYFESPYVESSYVEPPYVESTPAAHRGTQSNVWTDLRTRKRGLSEVLSASHLLPSQFPPENFGALESSPPDVERQFNSFPATNYGASPQPTTIKRVGKRGRPRKYTIDAIDSLNTSNSSTTLQRGPAPVYDYSNSVPSNNMFTMPPVPTSIVPPRQPAVSAFPSHSQKPNNRSQRFSAGNFKKRSSKSDRGSVKRGSHQKEVGAETFPIFTTAKTPNGMPVFSSKVFEMACKHQSNINGAEASALRLALAERCPYQSQFSTNGLGFNFSINMNGKASIETTTRAGSIEPSNEVVQGSSKRSSSSFVKEVSDSDSDEEVSDSVNQCVKTPPRFSSLGSSDAATAFAKSIARTNDNGNGFMFLFPPVSTPDKHAQLTSYVPCTPRTPRAPVLFDETSFSMQMHTPPGAMFPYDSPSNPYTTGMTPYLPSARSACRSRTSSFTNFF